MKKSILFLVLFVAVTLTAHTQNKTRPWLVGVSTNYADFHAVKMSFSDQMTDANLMGNTIVSQLKVGRLLSKEIVFSVEVSMINLETDKLNSWGYIEKPITKTNDMWRFQGQFQYKFANGYLLNEASMFDPYVFLGVNGTQIDKATYLAQSTGLGFNIWVTDWLAVNAQASYDYVFDFNDYMHYSFGIATKFGKKAAKEIPTAVVTEIVVLAPEKAEVVVPDPIEESPDDDAVAEEDVPPVIDPVKAKEIEKTLQSFADRIEFETAKYVIKPSSYPKLDDIVQTMQEYPNAKFAIEGHTDNVGSEEDNQTLSESRAYAVRQYFVDKGINPDRLTFKGYGELRPRATNETAAGRATNRRVEIRLIQ